MAQITEQLRIYYVSRTDGVGFDQFSDFVVATSDEEAARSMFPYFLDEGNTPQDIAKRNNGWKNAGEDGDDGRVWYSSAWISYDHRDSLVVKLIGVAADNIPPGLISASFNGG